MRSFWQLRMAEIEMSSGNVVFLHPAVPSIQPYHLEIPWEAGNSHIVKTQVV